MIYYADGDKLDPINFKIRFFDFEFLTKLCFTLL